MRTIAWLLGVLLLGPGCSVAGALIGNGVGTSINHARQTARANGAREVPPDTSTTLSTGVGILLGLAIDSVIVYSVIHGIHHDSGPCTEPHPFVGC